MSPSKHHKRSLIERLEQRQMLSKPAPIIKFGQPVYYFTDIADTYTGGSGPSLQQYLAIRNAGDLPLVLKSNSIQISGTDASNFSFGGKTVPATIQPGESRTFKIFFTASDLSIADAKLTINSNDPKRRTIFVGLRGLGQKGAGGDLEPSLQKVIDLYDFPVNVGDSNPDSTKFIVPPTTPNDETSMQTMVKAGTGKVSIEMMGLFVNDLGPAWSMGWYTDLGDLEARTAQLFDVPSRIDSQSAAPRLRGKTEFDPGTATFGIYAAYPGFNNRKSFSQDGMNTWEPKSQNRKKIRFYPLKNPDGTAVPNAYIFACEDWNVDYDFQDGVGIIRNVKPGPAGKQIAILNTDGSPGNDRVLFSRMNVLDPIRPNVFKEFATVRIVNPGDSSLTVSSIKLGDGTNFKITSGGGSNIKLAPGATRDVIIQFITQGSGVVRTYTSTLTITSDDPETPVKVLDLAGVWQVQSEKTADNKYAEPTLLTIVNAFGYKTIVQKDGEKQNHGGKPVKVGDEVLSAYWKLVDPSLPAQVRQIAAYHRQNNFDDITGEPMTAAASVRWFYKGSPQTTTKIFVHNINEGQTLLPHLDNSTTKWAEGSARPDPSRSFGFKVDARYSDDSLNPLDYDDNLVNIPGTGHAFRFFPLKDTKGNLVPNTWIMAHDYTSNPFANYDYQDNVYIVSNIKPASTNSTSSVTTGPVASVFSEQKVPGTKDEPTNEYGSLL